MTTDKPARFRRLGAVIVDFYSMLLSVLPLFFAAELLPPAGDAVLGCFGSFFCIGCLYCRDYLLGGRSLGKRLFGLSVVDGAGGAPATGKQLLVKDLCLILGPFEAIALLVTGRSIGERLSGTAVVRDRIPGPIEPKRFAKVAAAAAVLGLVMVAVISMGLNAAMKNESYALAHAYLTESTTFAVQEAPDAQPVLVGFSSTTHGTEASHHYTFETEDHTYTVTCHPGEGGWAVCEECTELE